jgi:hypothetical protein
MADIISGVTGLISGLGSAGAAKDAAKAQADAVSKAVEFSKQVYGTAQGNLQPYLTTGTNALSAVAGIYGLPSPSGSDTSPNVLDQYNKFTSLPTYQFPLQQGIQAMDRSAASKGLSLSPGTLNAIQQYGQNYASTNFGNYVNALSQLANLGPTSQNILSQTGASSGNQVLTGQTAIGNANAAGIVGAQTATNQAISNIPLLLGYGGNPAGGIYGSSYGTTNQLGSFINRQFASGGGASGSGGAVGGNLPAFG